MKSMEEKVKLITPNQTIDDVVLKYRSEYGKSGCEGFVQPASLVTSNEERLVQVKSFYKESYDDRGDHFSQDPNKKAEESYEALKALKEMGFKVVPYFALAKTEKDNLLVLDDLTNGDSIEIYDEKQLHRNKDIAELIINNPSFYKIDLELLRNSLLKTIYNINLGFGVSQMVTRNPKTNELDIFVTDVGEYHQEKYEGKLSKLLIRNEFILNDPLLILSQLVGNKTLAEEIFQKYKGQNPVKLEFMNLTHRACISLAFGDDWGGWYREPEWARRKFVKNSFNDKFMKIKLALDNIIMNYRDARHEDLFNCDGKSKKTFVSSLRSMNKRGLLNGIDISYQGCIDHDLFYLYLVEEKGETFAKPEIILESSLPKLNFLDDYFEKRNDMHMIKIFGDQTVKDEAFKIEAGVDLETWVKVEMSLHKPFLDKDEIKMIFINDEPVRNFDSKKIKIVPQKLGIIDCIYYVYEDQIFYRYYPKSKKHFKKLRSKIKSKS